LLQGGLALLGSVLEASGLGIAVAVLLGVGSRGSGSLLPDLPPRLGVGILVALMASRAVLQALMTVGQERLRNDFSDRLRTDLLARVVYAPSSLLAGVGRGELLGLLTTEINRSVVALDYGLSTLQALLGLSIYAIGVVVVGRAQALPLLLGLAAAGMAALLQRSGAWELGQLQTRLNGAIHRTLGDGLHGLKAVRAAAAEGWLLHRFSEDSIRFRRVVHKMVGRQAVFTALRDILVVLAVGFWLLLGRGELGAAAVTTVLMLAYRAAGSLGSVIASLRVCRGFLPGYGELCRLRQLLGSDSAAVIPAVRPALVAATELHNMVALTPAPGSLRSVRWRERQPSGHERTHESMEELVLHRGELTVVAGASGSGKTTLLDGFCGLLGEEHGHWELQTSAGTKELASRPGARRWRQLVAYAPQEAVLFEGSLRENLLLERSGRGAPSDAEIVGWLGELELAYLLERHGGLDGQLNLSLDCFSGGEIHRLGLLRAWLMDRPVEVLDEPTAFLDAVSAEQVRRILLKRCRERLVLVSSHDPGLIAAAGRLIRRTPADRPRAEALHQAPEGPPHNRPNLNRPATAPADAPPAAGAGPRQRPPRDRHRSADH
jgi:ABC-type transport system involved in cytochrome bd biosynthesis fused ATPase/permease subunit